MASKPSRLEFNLGNNPHGQPVKVVRDLITNGTYRWSIHRGQANQRDDSAVVGELTTDMLIQIGQIATEYQR